MPLITDQESFRLMYKTSDEARASTTTVADDSELFIQLEAFKKYLIIGCIFYDIGVAGSPNIKIAFNSPSNNIFARKISPLGTGVTDFDFEQTIGVGTQQGALLIRGSIEMGSDSDTLVFRWAQGTSSAVDVTVQEGSFFQVVDL